MGKLKFYEVSKEYISFLKQYDPKIPNIDYAGSHDKFICGVLFEMSGRHYFAPISSFAKQQKTNFLIRNKKGQVLSSIRFSFMFPAPTSQVWLKDFSKEELGYRRLLQEEYTFCRINEEKIIDRATYIYQAALSGKDPVIQKSCCNFKAIEQAHDLYIEQQFSQKTIPTEKMLPSLTDRIAAAETEAARRNAERSKPQPPRSKTPERE